MPDAACVLEGLAEEVAYAVEDIEGAIPREIDGTLLRNGPGLLQVGQDPLAMLDGHGAVAGLTLKEGRAVFRSRLTQTEILKAERAANRMLKRRAFTNLPSRWKNLFNIDFRDSCNHDVFAFDQTVYASDTFGWYALDGETLETKGPERLNGAVHGDIQTSPMPRVDPTSGRLICFTLQPGKLGPDVVQFRELGPGLAELKQVTWRMPGNNNLLHDLAFTERYYVVIRFGQLNPVRVLGGGAPLWSCVDFDPAKTPRLFLVPRDGDTAKTVSVPLGERLTFHVFNAFERDGKVIVDTTGLPSRIDFSATYPKSLLDRYKMQITPTAAPTVQRHVIDPATSAITTTAINGITAEAPEVDERRHGRPHRFGYAAARTEEGDEVDKNGFFFFHGVGKIDFDTRRTETWSAGPRAFCSPPAFVPRSDNAEEDDGWLLAWILDCARGRTDVVILDSRNLGGGPVATVHLKHRLGAVSHTRFERSIALRV